MAFGILKDILGIVGAGIGIFNAFSGQDEPEGTQEILALARQSAKFAEALDPNSPIFKQLVGEEEATIRRNTIEGLRQLRVQNRRALARGNVGILINPERRDEAIASATTTAFQQAKEAARNEPGTSSSSRLRLLV